MKLANALNGSVKQKSNYRRIQRFFAHFDLSDALVVRLILHLLPIKSDFNDFYRPHQLEVGQIEYQHSHGRDYL